MIETENQSLQSVLHDKYGIQDTVFAEGRFVSMYGEHAPSLVCLGLTMKSLVKAKIVFNDDVMDYDVLSITPLPLMSSMSFHNEDKTIKIRSQFKPIQSYQLCSSADQAEVWNNFTSIISYLNQLEKQSIWQPALLKPVIAPTPVSDSQCVQPYCPRFTESSVSLPTRLPSHVEAIHDNVFPNFISCENLDAQFDHFVNDAPILRVAEQKLKTREGLSSSDISLDNEDSSTSCSGFRKFFRRAFPCCFRKK